MDEPQEMPVPERPDVPPAHGVGAGHPDHYTEAHREMIADRTGELMEAAFSVAEKHIRPLAVGLRDPRDDTLAHFLIGSDNTVRAIPAESFDPYRTQPLRRAGSSKHERIESFIGIVNRFKAAETVIYANANPLAGTLTAIFDYHPESSLPCDTGFAGHRAAYPCPVSPEWKAWYGSNDEWMTMGEFAHFLEDHIVDVLDEPGGLSSEAETFVKRTGGKFASPSKLIELSRGLQVYENSVVKEAKNLSTGEAQFTFDATHTDADGKPLAIPSLFVIAIPVFERSSVLDRIIARLRYRKTAQGLVFSYELWRPDLVFANAFEDVVDKVRTETDVPVFYGSPET